MLKVDGWQGFGTKGGEEEIKLKVAVDPSDQLAALYVMNIHTDVSLSINPANPKLDSAQSVGGPPLLTFAISTLPLSLSLSASACLCHFFQSSLILSLSQIHLASPLSIGYVFVSSISIH